MTFVLSSTRMLMFESYCEKWELIRSVLLLLVITTICCDQSANRCNDLLRRIGNVRSANDVDIAVSKHFSPFFDFSAFEPYHEWNSETDSLAGLDQCGCDGRTPSDATEYVD